MKLKYEFKQMDCVDCTNLSDEQVQSILDRMWELGAKKLDDLEGRGGIYQWLAWSDDSDTWFYSELHDHKQVFWEDIMKAQQKEIKKPLHVLEDPTTWECFKEVAAVLGEEDAEYELKKVLYKHLDGCEELELEIDKGVTGTFYWRDAPQGDDFWRKIEKGDTPEEYKELSTDNLKQPRSIVEVISEPVVEDFTPTPTLSIGDTVKQLETALSGFESISVVFEDSITSLYHNSGVKVDVTGYDAECVTECCEFLSKYGERIVAVGCEGEVYE